MDAASITLTQNIVAEDYSGSSLPSMRSTSSSYQVSTHPLTSGHEGCSRYRSTEAISPQRLSPQDYSPMYERNRFLGFLIFVLGVPSPCSITSVWLSHWISGVFALAPLAQLTTWDYTAIPAPWPCPPCIAYLPDSSSMAALSYVIASVLRCVRCSVITPGRAVIGVLVSTVRDAPVGG